MPAPLSLLDPSAIKGSSRLRRSFEARRKAELAAEQGRAAKAEAHALALRQGALAVAQRAVAP